MKILPLSIATFAMAALLSSPTYAQFSAVGAHARLSDMNNAEANGGGDTSLIGINAAGINNWGINQWDLSSIAGSTVTGVTLTFTANQGFTNANHGSAADTISLHQMYDTNAGWLEGGQIISGSNVQISGSATYNFQSQTSATTGTPWQDASGTNVANLLGAFDPTPIDSVAGWAQGAASAEIEFTIPIALAQSWVDDPAAFAGLVLVSNDDGDSLGRFNFVANPATLTIDTGSSILLGDVDLSGIVDFADIGPFITVLSTNGFQDEADCDESGIVDFADIAAFITILSGP